MGTCHLNHYWDRPHKKIINGPLCCAHFLHFSKVSPSRSKLFFRRNPSELIWGWGTTTNLRQELELLFNFRSYLCSRVVQGNTIQPTWKRGQRAPLSPSTKTVSGGTKASSAIYSKTIESLLYPNIERNQLIKVQDKAETTKSCSRRRHGLNRRALSLVRGITIYRIWKNVSFYQFHIDTTNIICK